MPLQVDAQEVILEMAVERFRKAPKEQEAVDRKFDEEIQDFFGVAPHWQGSVGATSDLLEHERETEEKRM